MDQAASKDDNRADNHAHSGNSSESDTWRQLLEETIRIPSLRKAVCL